MSQATVARTFASPEKVSPATKDKVHAAADRLGYVPNAIASSLKSQRTGIVGAVMPSSGEYWQHVLSEFSRELGVQGCQLLVFGFDDASAIDDVLETVRRYRLDGLVLASSIINPAVLGAMHQHGVPIVAFNQPAANGVVPSVSVDNEAGSASLADHLVARGVTSVLYVGGDQSASTDQARYVGAARQLGEYGIALPYFSAGSFDYTAGYVIAAELIEHGPLPGALMVASDELAFGVVDGLRSAGVVIPDDVMVTGFDGLPQAGWAGYDLTTLVQPTRQLAATAVRTLLEDVGPGPFVVAGDVRDGATTRITVVTDDDDTFTPAPRSTEDR